MKGNGVIPNVSITERARLVKDHICSAALFARNTFEIERVYHEYVPQNHSEQLEYDHTAYVIASIFATDAYLEAAINTVFLDAIESTKLGKPYGVVAQLDCGMVLYILWLMRGNQVLILTMLRLPTNLKTHSSIKPATKKGGQKLAPDSR